jgi:hypothetical protein
MFLHTKNGGAVNGSVINGRGLRHRKLSHKQRVALAADVVTGEKPYEPSQAQYCSVFGITPAALRAELRARGVGGNSFSQEFKRWCEAWNGLSLAERKQAVLALSELIHKS